MPRTSSRIALPLMLLAQFVIPLSIAGVAVALPAIASDLGASAKLPWVVNGFNLAFACLTLLWGFLADRFGQHRILICGVVMVAAGAFLSAGVTQLSVLILARILAGSGAAAVLTCCVALISSSYEGSARARAFALFGTVNGLGLAFGPSISGVLVGLLGWRSVFAVQAALMFVVLLGSPWLPQGQAPAAGNATPQGQSLSILRNRTFLAFCLVPVAASLSFVTFLTYLPSAFIAVYHQSAQAAGGLMLLATLPVLVMPLLAHRALSAGWLSSASALKLSFWLLVAGNLLFLLSRPTLPAGLLALPMLLIGTGFGLPLGLLDGAALASVPQQLSATASGVLNTFRIGSEAVAVAVYGTLLSLNIRRQISDSGLATQLAAQLESAHTVNLHQQGIYNSAFHSVAAVLALLTALIAAAYWWLQQQPQAGVANPAGG